MTDFPYHVILDAAPQRRTVSFAGFAPCPFYVDASTSHEAIRKARMQATARGLVTTNVRASRRVPPPANGDAL